jgi:hypothetical protein
LKKLATKAKTEVAKPKTPAPVVQKLVVEDIGSDSDEDSDDDSEEDKVDEVFIKV